jgi:hypothetical protein
MSHKPVAPNRSELWSSPYLTKSGEALLRTTDLRNLAFFPWDTVPGHSPMRLRRLR